MALANLSIYYTWKNINSEYNNNKFKISAPTWNKTFDLPDGSYSIDDIQDYFEFIIKRHETLTENPPVQIYSNKIKNRIVFKIKTGYPANIRLEDVFRLCLRRTSSRRLQDVLIKMNMFASALRLQKTSWSRPIYSSWLYVFKTSSRRLEDVLQKGFQDIFKTSSRSIIKLNCSC